MIPKLGNEEKLEVVDRIDGFTDQDVEDMIADAEAGVDFPEALDGTTAVLLKLPQDIRAEILRKASDQNCSVEDIIAEALIRGA